MMFGDIFQKLNIRQSHKALIEQGVGPLHPAPILPMGDMQARSLSYLLMIMGFLASLFFWGLSQNLRQVSQWQSGIGGHVSIQIYPDQVRAQSEQHELAYDIISASDKIRTLRRVPDVEARQLLDPWLGNINLPSHIPLPILYSVRLKQAGDNDLGDIESLLSAQGLEASILQQSDWVEEARSTSRIIKFGLWSLFLIILGTTMLIVMFATRSVIMSQEKIINVMDQVGAQKSFIVKEFTGRFFYLAIKAKFIGAAIAIFVCLGLSFSLEAFGHMSIEFSGYDIFKLGGLILILSLIAGGAAGMSALNWFSKYRNRAQL